MKFLWSHRQALLPHGFLLPALAPPPRRVRLVEPVTLKKNATSLLAQDQTGASIIKPRPVVRRKTVSPAVTEPSPWQLAVNKVRRKYRSFITKTATAKELPIPMDNVRSQLPGQRGYVALHRIRHADQPTVTVTSHRGDPFRQAKLLGHDPPVAEDSCRGRVPTLCE